MIRSISGLVPILVYASLACGDTGSDTDSSNMDSTSVDESTSATASETSSQSGDGDGDSSGDGDGETEMVEIPAGEFIMGCDPEQDAANICDDDTVPARNVYLDAYEIDRLEVTVESYLECVAAGQCPEVSSSCAENGLYANPDFPILCLTHSDAAGYCAWADKRLPTEAEWEKAARGSNGYSTFPWGEGEASCEYMSMGQWNAGASEFVGGCGTGLPAPVGSYPNDRSEYGVFDMGGNGSEWVSDWYAADYYASAPSENPQGPDSSENDERSKRGWSWSASENIDTGRVSNRNYGPDWSASERTTFRCARSR